MRCLTERVSVQVPPSDTMVQYSQPKTSGGEKLPQMTSPTHTHIPTRLLKLTLVGWALVLASVSAWSQADPYARVNQLLRAKQFTQALNTANGHLANNPRDPQMRLLLGVAHAENGDLGQAKAVYLALTQEFPELPEPHNNLATIYAQEAEFGLARESLEMAIRLNPRYAVAHENLGDVYVRLARESYARAASLDRNAVTIGPKRIQLETVLRPPAPATTPKQP
jgi:tetratricopeptide (TPR) repeat protein